jgi:hypothetical protein
LKGVQRRYPGALIAEEQNKARNTLLEQKFIIPAPLFQVSKYSALQKLLSQCFPPIQQQT